MSSNNVRLSIVIATAILASFTTVQGAPLAVVDQQNTGPGPYTFTNFDTLGDGVTQGFTPIYGGIDALELLALTNDTSTSLRIDIFAGDGDGGLLLGSSGAVVLTNTEFATTHFDFPTTVALTPNALHSFRITHLGGTSARMLVSGNNYAGGIPRNPDSTAYSDYDLIFKEGLHTPEPAGLATVAMGLLAISCCRWPKQTW